MKLAWIGMLGFFLVEPLLGQEGNNPPVGSRATEFTLPLVVSEQTVSLSDFLGKKAVILHFWKAG